MKPLSWAAKKKLQYSLGFLVVFLLLAGYPLYVVINSVFYNPPSCFDNVTLKQTRLRQALRGPQSAFRTVDRGPPRAWARDLNFQGLGCDIVKVAATQSL